MSQQQTQANNNRAENEATATKEEAVAPVSMSALVDPALDNDDDDDESDEVIDDSQHHNFAAGQQHSEPFSARLLRQSNIRHLAIEAEKETVRRCFPKGFTSHLIPLCLSVVALAFTGAGSWDCTYFSGAHIEFTGNHYGLWTLEDSLGKCQLWDVLFFAFDLGPPLIAARVFSMTAMLLGLSLSATMAQASQFHLASWGIGLALFLLFVVSLSTTDIFNVWVVFWLFSYAIMVLIIRYLFIHPVPRRISQRGAKIISSVFILCGACCLLTLVVLTSDYCTCAGLTTERLDGRDPGEPCNGTCEMGFAGYCMIVASVLYVAAAICCLKYGIQPEELQVNSRRPKELYAHYPQQSIVTRVTTFVGSATRSSGNDESKATTSSSVTSKPNGRDEEDEEVSKDPSSSLATSTLASSATEDNDDSAGNKVVSTSALEAIGEHESKHDTLVPDKLGTSNNQELDDENTDQEEEEDAEASKAVHDWHNNKNTSELLDRRSCCQKCCCDFRVTPRTRWERFLFWSFRTGLGFGLVIYGLFIYMLIGSRHENTIAGKKPDTTPYFTLDAVCAYNPDNPNQPFETFVNRDAAKARNWTVAHCGECGYCSNPHDIITYVETRKTIAKSSKKCGPNVYLGTYEDLADCLEERIGFTRPCTNCWADNMISTGEKCLSTCLRTLFSGFMTDNNVPGAGDEGWMNQCLFCDEKRSGPAFVTCSGVARRRLGIVSEIERNPEEQCKRMDIDWVNVKWDDIGFEKTEI